MTDKPIDFNDISFWYPKIKNLVPTPKTEILPLSWNLKGNNIIIDKECFEKIKEVAKKFEFPVFIRGSHGSGKHEWKNTCFVKTIGQ